MWTALFWKELRECGLYAGMALVIQIHVLGEGMDLPLIPLLSNGRGVAIPFLTQAEETFTMIAVVAAIVLGLHQTAWESWRQTTLYLLHRPMPRTQIFAVKMVAGSLLLLGVAALPLMIYCLWAAMPGTHPSPFYWGMTESWWRSVAIAWVCYLGAFLTGLRPAHWLGSRTWPLISALVISLALKFGINQLPISIQLAAGLSYTAYLLVGAGLVASILETSQRREFP